MSKFYGTVGFVKTEETTPGVWTQNVTRREYVGDLQRFIQRYDTGNKVNSDVSLNNQVSIVSDPYAIENFQYIKFIEFLGTAWKVTSIDINYPRMLLSLGEVYKGDTGNEEQTGTTSETD